MEEKMLRGAKVLLVFGVILAMGGLTILILNQMSIETDIDSLSALVFGAAGFFFDLAAIMISKKIKQDQQEQDIPA